MYHFPRRFCHGKETEHNNRAWSILFGKSKKRIYEETTDYDHNYYYSAVDVWTAGERERGER